ncbi:Methyltransferase domain-containing protein [Desulfuromusa kysingii]|uniref:Methyltransferase domain-containing protein n=1 Tax=Desulfuromusa kysingii TaxID=37625 RepID=A0A1H4C5L5_9BACT|nr:class I SAM-dependent methyltransferase [Desulfuromusa kysingii]SEA55668.1 Methyltransferase domain-containing protein [Desulfuromusa kysingii]
MKWRVNTTPDAFTHSTVDPCRFGALNSEVIFSSLELDVGSCLVDAGCGPGEYSVLAARLIGETGSVIALDRDPWMIEQLRQTIAAQAITNIHCQVADLGAPLPLRDQQADAVMISAVLHMPGLTDRWQILFSELQRGLRKGGKLAIIEKSNASAPADHPLHLRLSPETIAANVTPHGFEQCGLVELRADKFLILFEKY